MQDGFNGALRRRPPAVQMPRKRINGHFIPVLGNPIIALLPLLSQALISGPRCSAEARIDAWRLTASVARHWSQQGIFNRGPVLRQDSLPIGIGATGLFGPPAATVMIEIGIDACNSRNRFARSSAGTPLPDGGITFAVIAVMAAVMVSGAPPFPCSRRKSAAPIARSRDW